MESLVGKDARCRVSSVLNRDAKQYGKQFLFDGSEETCWSSDQGELQHIVIEFGRDVSVGEVRIMFQGGFACGQLSVLGAKGGDDFADLARFYPEDVNAEQSFTLPSPSPPVDRIKLVLEQCTDFYGRVTVYRLDVLGGSSP